MTLTQRIRCLSNAVREDRFLSAVAEHIAITKALTASDSDGAAKAMLVHLENSEKDILELHTGLYDLKQRRNEKWN